jgi:hypothetical protein
MNFGTGINIFRKARQAVTIGYRYQHLSNANISQHNPGHGREYILCVGIALSDEGVSLKARRTVFELNTWG